MSDATEAGKADHERIWLEAPPGDSEGRLWCEDKVWPIEAGDGEPTEYVRADIHAAALALIESQRATIESLRRTVQTEAEGAQRWIDECATAEARVTALEAEKAELRAALEPFARYAEGIGHFTGPQSPFFFGFSNGAVGDREITEADFLAARQALAQPSTQEKTDD